MKQNSAAQQSKAQSSLLISRMRWKSSKHLQVHHGMHNLFMAKGMDACIRRLSHQQLLSSCSAGGHLLQEQTNQLLLYVSGCHPPQWSSIQATAQHQQHVSHAPMKRHTQADTQSRTCPSPPIKHDVETSLHHVMSCGVSVRTNIIKGIQKNRTDCQN
jgi:methionine-rich copper-binding protein CopC